MTDLDRADRIMALPPRTWIMAMEPATVGDMENGGTILLPPGAKVRISLTTSTSAFGYTEDARHVSFGMLQASGFEPVPNKVPKDSPSR